MENLTHLDHELNLKIVVVGDGNVGKTSLLISYCQNRFPRDYVPTVFDTHVKDVTVDHFRVKLTLWDTAGQEDYDRIRPLSYSNTDVFLICFALDNKGSFENIRRKWVPEVKSQSKRAKLILVGLKSDLRLGNSTCCVTESLAKSTAKEINAYRYVECSAMTQDGLYDVFDTAIKSIMLIQHERKSGSKQKGNCCLIL